MHCPGIPPLSASKKRVTLGNNSENYAVQKSDHGQHVPPLIKANPNGKFSSRAGIVTQHVKAAAYGDTGTLFECWFEIWLLL